MGKNYKPKDYTKNFILVFAGTSTAICFVYIFLITFMKIPAANQRYADICLGFLLGTFLATIIQFFYGSTQSSKEKDNALGMITQSHDELTQKLKNSSTETSITTPDSSNVNVSIDSKKAPEEDIKRIDKAEDEEVIEPSKEKNEKEKE